MSKFTESLKTQFILDELYHKQVLSNNAVFAYGTIVNDPKQALKELKKYSKQRLKRFYTYLTFGGHKSYAVDTLLVLVNHILDV